MAAVVFSQAGFAIMHLTQSDSVNPVATPVSSYVLTWPGIVLFPLSTLALGLACAILAGRGVGLPRDGFIRFLLGATTLMLVGAALFKTGTPESGLTFGAQIHRYTAGAAFVLLTVVAGLCAARMRDAAVPDWVRRATWAVTILAALTFLTTTVNTFLPGLADGGDWRGIPQRVLLVILSALVWILIANSSRITAPATVPALAASPRGATPHMAPAREASAVPALAASRS